MLLVSCARAMHGRTPCGLEQRCRLLSATLCVCARCQGNKRSGYIGTKWTCSSLKGHRRCSGLSKCSSVWTWCWEQTGKHREGVSRQLHMEIQWIRHRFCRAMNHHEQHRRVKESIASKVKRVVQAQNKGDSQIMSLC